MKSRHRFLFLLPESFAGLPATFSCWLAIIVISLLAGAARAADPSAKELSSDGSSSSNQAFVVFGKITDAAGKPLDGVKVFANCGIGTLLRTGSAVTDANGAYRLPFGPGVLAGRLLHPGPFGVAFQVATISAHKPGYFTQGLGQTGNLAMTDYTNVAPGWSTSFSGLVRPFHPYRLDFILLPAASLQGRLLDPFHLLPGKINLCLNGEKHPPSTSVYAQQTFGEDGAFHFASVPVGFSWWFELMLQEGNTWKTIRSKPLFIPQPASRTLRLTATSKSLEVDE